MDLKLYCTLISPDGERTDLFRTIECPIQPFRDLQLKIDNEWYPVARVGVNVGSGSVECERSAILCESDEEYEEKCEKYVNLGWSLLASR